MTYILENVIHEQREQQLQNFKKYTGLLDQLRKNDFKASLPELSQYLQMESPAEKAV